MVEYNIMKQTPKQLLAQKVLAQHTTLRVERITLMYTSITPDTNTQKMPVIVVSVPKKSVPKATKRNYIKRVLRAILRQNVPLEILRKNIWMWICKEPTVTKEIRLQLIEKLKTLTA